MGMFSAKLQFVSGDADRHGPCVIRATKALYAKVPGVNPSNEMEVNASWAEITSWKQSGALIQDVLPNLPQEQAEFLMSGTTPEEWRILFPPEEGEG